MKVKKLRRRNIKNGVENFQSQKGNPEKEESKKKIFYQLQFGIKLTAKRRQNNRNAVILVIIRGS